MKVAAQSDQFANMNKDQVEIEQILHHLGHTENGRIISKSFIEKFKVIEEKFLQLNVKEQNIFAGEYKHQLRDAFESLDKVINNKAIDETVDQLYFIVALFPLFVLVLG